MKILIVEDEPALRELVQRSLEKERYVTEVAADFDSALEKIELYDYDCVLLDIMLPGGSGLDLLERLKELRKKENVIIISAKDSLDDKVLGLELGADDYLPKPFHLAELTARVKSVLRRKHRDGEHTLTVGNVRVQPDTFQVWVDGKPLELSRKEYDILHYFLNRPNRMVNKQTLAESVWGDHNLLLFHCKQSAQQPVYTKPQHSPDQCFHNRSYILLYRVLPLKKQPLRRIFL